MDKPQTLTFLDMYLPYHEETEGNSQNGNTHTPYENKIQ